MIKIDLNIVIGKRLREVRGVFSGKANLSCRKFAIILDETRSVLANYESGRTSIPADFLNKLYERGINPIYIIAGEGSMFAENKAGIELKAFVESKIKSKTKKIHTPESNKDKGTVVILEGDGIADLTAPIISVAAGRLKNTKKDKSEKTQ